jgi:hypothetical protein
MAANSVSFSGGFDAGAGGGAGYPGHIAEEPAQAQLFTPGAPAPPQQPGAPSPYGGMPSVPSQSNFANGQPQAPQMGGYQQGGMAGVTSQFQGMGIGGQQQQQMGAKGVSAERGCHPHTCGRSDSQGARRTRSTRSMSAVRSPTSTISSGRRRRSSCRQMRASRRTQRPMPTRRTSAARSTPCRRRMRC